jgi:hypothetical protein
VTSEDEIEAAGAREKLGIGVSLQTRITKVKGNNYMYASRGDTKAFIDEIERLNNELARVNK